MFSVKVQRVTISGFGAELHNSAFVVQKQQQRQNDESDSSKITLQKQASDRIWQIDRLLIPFLHEKSFLSLHSLHNCFYSKFIFQCR